MQHVKDINTPTFISSRKNISVIYWKWITIHCFINMYARVNKSYDYNMILMFCSIVKHLCWRCFAGTQQVSVNTARCAISPARLSCLPSLNYHLFLVVSIFAKQYTRYFRFFLADMITGNCCKVCLHDLPITFCRSWFGFIMKIQLGG